MKEIAGILKQKHLAGISIQEITAYYRNKYSDEIVKRCVMFLMKRGMVKLYR